MTKLADIYGYCIIPKNTLLFRGHSDASFEDCMFFATKRFVAGAFNDTIQVWKTATDIQVLFLVEYLNHRSWAISALPQLFNSIFPSDSNPNFDDLDIKHWDTNRRNKLVRKLFDDYKIFGWLTSLENKVELEVCLFDKETNSKQLLPFEKVGRGNKNYFKDSLCEIKILPSKNFFDKTNHKLDRHAPLRTGKKSYYKTYKSMIDAQITAEVQNGMDKVVAKHYLLDLRTKLKT